jgi:hypothetical protein
MMIGAHHEDWTINKNKQIKNKFVSPYPTDHVKISRLEIFLLEICRHFFFLVSLKICFAENSIF